MLFKIHSSRFHEICLASEKKAGVHCMFFSCRAQAKDTPDKKDTVPSSSPPTLQNGPVWSRTFVLDWVLIILVLWASPQGSVFIQPYTAWSAHGCEWLWQRTYFVWEYISTIISERLLLFMLRDTKTVFLLIKVILIFSKKKLEANFVFCMLYSCKTKIQ